jgi:hypothetical protein
MCGLSWCGYWGWCRVGDVEGVVVVEKTRDELLAEAEALREAGDTRPVSQIVAEDAARADVEGQSREDVGKPRDEAAGARDVEGRPNP